MSEPAKKPAVFIDESVVIHEGAEAEAMLKNKAQFQKVDARYGIATVDKSRWEEAQRYEKHTWMNLNQSTSTDRNEDHRKNFDNYKDLEGRIFQRGIELGCGPFTNMRLIIQHCKVDKIYLLDPLIESYLHHPFCQYKKHRLGGVFNIGAGSGVPKTFQDIRRRYRAGGWLGKPVQIVSSMIEEYQVQERFNLAVMINVIEHCQNVFTIFQKISDLLLPGGTFVFHDRLYNARKLEELTKNLYDAGHPLRVDQSVIHEFLKTNFETIMSREMEVSREFKGVIWKETELFFIGEKK
jgi:SAM-dependent methyltransferase